MVRLVEPLSRLLVESRHAYGFDWMCVESVGKVPRRLTGCLCYLITCILRETCAKDYIMGTAGGSAVRGGSDEVVVWPGGEGAHVGESLPPTLLQLPAYNGRWCGGGAESQHPRVLLTTSPTPLIPVLCYISRCVGKLSHQIDLEYRDMS
jgi:hypothetical protein